MASVLKTRMAVCLCLVGRGRCVPFPSSFSFGDCVGCKSTDAMRISIPPRPHSSSVQALLLLPTNSLGHASHTRRPLGQKVLSRSRYPIHQNPHPVDLILTVCRDAWRYQGMFSSWERFRPKHSFPGLGLGVGLFAVYLAYDFVFGRPAHGTVGRHTGPGAVSEHEN